MDVEIEAKFLNQDHNALRTKLKDLGALCEHPMKLMHRTVFDYPDASLLKKHAWVRLREELDGTIELTFKQSKDKTITGTHEAAVGVQDYKAAVQFLLAIGLRIKGEQESKREVWRLGEVEVMLDEWPWVKPFVEVEGSSEEAVRVVADQLGLKWSQAHFGGITPVYTAEYALSAEEFESLELSMQFDTPAPATLPAR